MMTVKLIGISGAGKTSLTKALSQKLDFFLMSFGNYIQQYGVRAKEQWSKDLNEANGLVIIEEHLEMGDEDLAWTYKQEKTKIIFFMDIESSEVLKRRINDTTRNRELDINKIKDEKRRARKRAFLLAKELRIPFVLLRGSVLESHIIIGNQSIHFVIFQQEHF